MGYRDIILNRVKADRGHPLFKGVKMQAHHLVSKSGVFISGLKADLEHLGYDINVWENLVLLPCTLQGACHLGVQLHRGNHSATADVDIFHGNGGDSDFDHLPYHAVVSVCLQGVRIQRNAGRLCRDTEGEIQKEINSISRKLLGMIQVFAVPLSPIHTAFLPGIGPGCCGCDATADAEEKLESAKKLKAKKQLACPTGRDHHRKQGPGQQAESITYRNGVYDLDVGR